MFENCKPVLVGDLRNEESWRGIYVGGKNIRSELDVPLIDSDRVIGVLNFESPRKNAFTERQKDFLRNISGQFVLALKRAQDYEARAAELKLFWDFSRDTVGHLDANQLLDITLKKTVATVGATAGALLRQDETGHFIVVTTHGYTIDDVPANSHHIDKDGLIGAAANELFHGAPTRLATESERWLMRDSPTVIVAPIRREPKLWGVILLTSDSPKGFNDSTIRITEAISGMIAIALENAEEYEKSEKDRQALHDLSAQVLQGVCGRSSRRHTLGGNTRFDPDEFNEIRSRPIQKQQASEDILLRPVERSSVSSKRKEPGPDAAGCRPVESWHT